MRAEINFFIENIHFAARFIAPRTLHHGAAAQLAATPSHWPPANYAPACVILVTSAVALTRANASKSILIWILQFAGLIWIPSRKCVWLCVVQVEASVMGWSLVQGDRPSVHVSSSEIRSNNGPPHLQWIRRLGGQTKKICKDFYSWEKRHTSHRGIRTLRRADWHYDRSKRPLVFTNLRRPRRCKSLEIPLWEPQISHNSYTLDMSSTRTFICWVIHSGEKPPPDLGVCGSLPLATSVLMGEGMFIHVTRDGHFLSKPQCKQSDNRENGSNTRGKNSILIIRILEWWR